jgi:hypothetical protein
MKVNEMKEKNMTATQRRRLLARRALATIVSAIHQPPLPIGIRSLVIERPPSIQLCRLAVSSSTLTSLHITRPHSNIGQEFYRWRRLVSSIPTMTQLRSLSIGRSGGQSFHCSLATRVSLSSLTLLTSLTLEQVEPRGSNVICLS